MEILIFYENRVKIPRIVLTMLLGNQLIDPIIVLHNAVRNITYSQISLLLGVALLYFSLYFHR